MKGVLGTTEMNDVLNVYDDHVSTIALEHDEDRQVALVFDVPSVPAQASQRNLVELGRHMVNHARLNNLIQEPKPHRSEREQATVRSREVDELTYEITEIVDEGPLWRRTVETILRPLLSFD